MSEPCLSDVGFVLLVPFILVAKTLLFFFCPISLVSLMPFFDPLLSLLRLSTDTILKVIYMQFKQNARHFHTVSKSSIFLRDLICGRWRKPSVGEGC